MEPGMNSDPRVFRSQHERDAAIPKAQYETSARSEGRPMIRRPSDATMPVIEWLAPVRDLDWVAACFGTVDA
jgi:hypothetical protein